VKNCLIYQPLGLGDVIWVQPIVDRMISDGFQVSYPVGDQYYEMVSSQMKKDGLTWYRESDDFPMKIFYGHHSKVSTDEGLYLPLSFADRHIPNCSVMASKYYFSGIPLSDWRSSFVLQRDREREKALVNKYGLYGDYIIVNESFGTNPASRNIPVYGDNVHRMSMQEDSANGFRLFDWIMALENAKEIHTVETSLCYLIDKFCSDVKMHMYEKRLESEANNYYNNVNMVYRNSEWVYES